MRRRREGRSIRGARIPTLLVLVGALSLSGVSRAEAQSAPAVTRADSAQAVFRKAQRLVTDGQGAEGRALVDSMLNAAEPGAPEEAEALFWRATLAESWDGAQRDYLRIMLEHDRSLRAGDAMLRLAQGEATRGDRDAAIRYLERLVREAPDSPARAEGALWHGRLLMERGDLDGGCAVLRGSRARVSAGAIELENQFDYLLRGCADASSVAAPTTATPASTPATNPTSNTAPNTAPSTVPNVTPTPAPAAPRPAASGAPMWSVQAAALTTRAEANALVAKLRARGYDARVDGTTAPFRVRFGLFPTRAAAAAALERFKAREKSDGFLVEAPRG